MEIYSSTTRFALACNQSEKARGEPCTGLWLYRCLFRPRHSRGGFLFDSSCVYVPGQF